MISTKHQYRSHTTVLLPFLNSDRIHISGNRSSDSKSYNFGTVIAFEAVGLNLKRQDLYPQQIYLKPIISLHHKEIYFKITSISTLQCNTTLSISCSISYVPKESS